MGDVVFVAVIVGFFAICAVYIRACARIIADGRELVPTDDAVDA
jgi:hypothetical protein